MKNLKKSILPLFLIFFVLFSFFSISFASSNTFENETKNTTNYIDEGASTELLEMKESTKENLETYFEKYGSKTYGGVAFILNKLRIFSIPLCFLGIAWGVIRQYVLGIRRADTRDRGFYMITIFITILLIFQVLPLIFAIIVRGWRG